VLPLPLLLLLLLFLMILLYYIFLLLLFLTPVFAAAAAVPHGSALMYSSALSSLVFATAGCFVLFTDLILMCPGTKKRRTTFGNLSATYQEMIGHDVLQSAIVRLH
jgi:hypothetical protein